MVGAKPGATDDLCLYSNLETAVRSSRSSATVSTSGAVSGKSGSSSGVIAGAGGLSSAAAFIMTSMGGSGSSISALGIQRPSDCFADCIANTSATTVSSVSSIDMTKEVLYGHMLLADWCCRHSIGIEAFVSTSGSNNNANTTSTNEGMPSPYTDMPLFAELCRKTGGSLHPIYYSLFTESNVEVLANEVINTFQMHAACDVILKLRCSIGIQVDSYLGSGRNSGNHSEVEVAVANTQFTCAFSFVYDTIMKDNDPVYFQFAVLYTAPNGLRKVRVHNLALKASSLAHAVFRNADLDCVTAYMFKVACSKVTESRLLVLCF
jgi:hypothetical protein